MELYNNPLVWSAFKRGDCVGIFQVETPLTSYWTRRLKPNNIEELSDVISLVRPGPLESLETEKYARRKIGEEPVEYIHESLETVLKGTQGIICYQETCSKIAGLIAGFSPAKQEWLRKSLSKKKPEEIYKAKLEFIEGAINKGIVSKEKAEEIFAIIEKFQRYGFVKAHGIEYAMNSYKSMECKVLHPVEFYCSWLTFADEKIDPAEERANLINDARLHNIKILPPVIKNKNIDFEITGERQITFGLSHIRGIGGSAVKALSTLKLDDFHSFLKSVPKLHRNVAESLIKSGACDCYGLSRTKMLRVIHALFGRSDKDSEEIQPEVKRLTPNELQQFFVTFESASIEESLKSIVIQGRCIAKRIPTIESKIKYIQGDFPDNNTNKSIWEKIYLGIALSCSAADDYKKQSEKVISCRRLADLPVKSKFVLHVVLDEVTEKRTSEKAKTPNQKFAVLKVSDSSLGIGSLMCWPKEYEKFKDFLIEGTVLEIEGYKNSWLGREQLTTNKITLIG